MYWTFSVLIRKSWKRFGSSEGIQSCHDSHKKVNNPFINLELYVYLSLMEVYAYADVFVLLLYRLPKVFLTFSETCLLVLQ